VALKEEHITEKHGVTLDDPYFWMRERGAEKVLSYLRAENDYTASQLAHTTDLQKRIYDEMLSRIKQTDVEVPYPWDNYYYYSRTEEGKQYSIFCRKEGKDGPEQILLDENLLAEGHEFSETAVQSISPNHKLLAYSHDTVGSEEYTIFIKDLSTGELLKEAIPNTYYSFEWANDNQTFFYTILDEAHRPFKVMRHKLGTDISQDVMIFHEEDERFNLGLDKTMDDKYIFICSESQITSEAWFINADNVDTEKFQLFLPRTNGVEYSVYHQNDRFLIKTNADGATNFKLMEVLESEFEPGTKNGWKEKYPYNPEVKLNYLSTFKDYLVIWERVGGMTTMSVLTLATGELTKASFPEELYVVTTGTNANYDQSFVQIEYQSLITPETTYNYNLKDHSLELLKRKEVLGGFDGSEYFSQRIYAKSRDGKDIPISIVYKKALFKPDGESLMLLYGYGAYGHTIEPYFNSNRLSLLDRGFVYAIAHIRGGGSMGRPWYEDGKLLKKRNTFNDFIDSAKFLHENKFSNPSKTAIMGASAGGLLMGAVLNMAPELFAAAVADVPFVDCINTMSDTSIPLTVSEFEEWGNPEDKEYFEYMISYSPYDNVGARNYPPLLVVSALNDQRVQYWEPSKWVAKLRAHKTDSNVLLLRTFMEEGHAGASGRYDALKEVAFTYAFIVDRFLGSK